MCIVAATIQPSGQDPHLLVHWEERMWQLHGMYVDVRLCRYSDAPTTPWQEFQISAIILGLKEREVGSFYKKQFVLHSTTNQT